MTTPPILQPRAKRWTFWQVIGRVCLGLILLCLIALIYLWSNRYAVIEDRLQAEFRARGYQTDFSIQSLGRTQAEIKNLSVKHIEASESIFGADEMKLTYAWRDAIKGRIDRLTLTGPRLFVEIDEHGALIRPILSPGKSGTGPDIIYPPQGVHIKNGRVDMLTPYGLMRGQANGVFYNPDRWTLDVDLNPGAFKYGNISGTGGGTVKIALTGDQPKLTFDLKFIDLAVNDIVGTDLFLTGDFTPEFGTERVILRGPLDMMFKSLALPDSALGRGHLNWQGRLSVPRNGLSQIHVDGDWHVDLQSVSVTDLAVRERLATTLSLYPALSQTPLAQNFAARPKAAMTRLLTTANVSAAGHMKRDSSGYVVTLTSPAIWSGAQDHVSFAPQSGDTTLNFTRDTGTLTAGGDMVMTGPAALSLFGLMLSADSIDGLRLQAVRQVNGRLHLPHPWTGTTQAGRAARLAPFNAILAYTATQTQRNFSITSAFDYDGDIPGGYVTGLKINGQTHVVLRDKHLTTDFKPQAGTVIGLDRFENVTGWHGEDLRFTIQDGQGPDYVRRGIGRNAVGHVTTLLSDVSGHMIEVQDARRLNLDFGLLDITGVLRRDQQNWRIEADQVNVNSPNIPAGGSTVTAPTAQMTARLQPAQPVNFTLSTSQADIATPTVTTDNMALEVEGTPEAFNVIYRDGLADMAANELPPLPLTGAVSFTSNPDGGTWTGTAQTFLPKAPRAPINATYSLTNGAGSADVDIANLLFTPGGLQPQDLISTLSGKISRVTGGVSAKIKLGFVPGQPLQSSGTASVNDLSMGTLTGPFTGVNANLTFSSFFPLQSTGRQTLTAQLFDPGFPLAEGQFEFEIIPDGVKLYSARWPLGDGVISLDPTEWIYSAPQNRVTLRLKDIGLGQFLNNIGNGDLYATGDVEGVLPVLIEGIRTEVVGGLLQVKDGGVIRYSSSQASAAAAQNDYANMAFEALKDFRYKKLEARLDGPLDGEITIRAEFDGRNPDVLEGATFAWGVTLEGELLNIARSFSPDNMNRIIQDSVMSGLIPQP